MTRENEGIIHQLFVHAPVFNTLILNFNQPKVTGKQIYDELTCKRPQLKQLLLVWKRLIVEPSDCFDLSAGISFLGFIPLLGGKGGFGSQLKASGNRMAQKKSTNFDSSRDLSGRRLRTVADATKLADYIQDLPKRKQREQLKIEKKIKDAKELQAIREVKVDHSKFFQKRDSELEVIQNAVSKGCSTHLTLALSNGPKKVVTKKTKASVWNHDESDD